MIFKADRFNRKRDFICRSCGCIGHGAVVTKGSRGMELFLWGVFLIPGPFYSWWRHATRYLVCQKCKSTALVPLDSPMGNELFEKAMHQVTKNGVF